MDKAKVISAYLKGFITLKECEQILGMESTFILGMVHERQRLERMEGSLQQSANT